MTTHRQVNVTLHGRRFKVDAGLVPLLEAVWALGFTTDYSCQGVDEPDQFYQAAYISFPHEDDADRFAAYAFNGVPVRTIHVRIVDGVPVTDDPIGGFEYLHQASYLVERWAAWPGGPAASVARWPASVLDEVTVRVATLAGLRVEATP